MCQNHLHLQRKKRPMTVIIIPLIKSGDIGKRFIKFPAFTAMKQVKPIATIPPSQTGNILPVCEAVAASVKLEAEPSSMSSTMKNVRINSIIQHPHRFFWFSSLWLKASYPNQGLPASVVVYLPAHPLFSQTHLRRLSRAIP